MERLTVEDTAFLEMENRVSAMHNVTIAVFEGPEPSFDEMADRVRQRIRAVPRLRQRVVSIPLDLGRPVWVDDEHFDLFYHLRHTGLPAKGTGDDFRNLVGRLLSQRLDRGKPLWELWLVSGLPRKQWAVLSKAHYSIVDGVSGTDPLSLIVDQSKTAVGDDSWTPESAPTARELMTRTAVMLAWNPVEQYRLARRRLIDPLIRSRAGDTERMRHASEAGLVGAVGPHRRWCQVTVDGEQINDLRDVHGVTTNDVVLAVITRGFRAMLQARGAPVPDSIRTLTPLAVATGDRFTNEINAIEADLPVGVDDLAETMSVIKDQTARLAATGKAVAGATLAELPGLIAPTLCGLGLRSAAQRGARLDDIETVTINAPGPNHPISMLNRAMMDVHPAVPLVSRVQIAVGVMSYQGRFGFGITGDRDADVDIAALAIGIEQATNG